MEASHSALSGPTQQDDSWTCHRCGWVYPNAHPSAKHRRNHKKHCGKIKGFELHKGGSSDEASSDDGTHADKESLLLQSSQTQHDSIRPSEASSDVQVVDPHNDLQSREVKHESVRPVEASSKVQVVDAPSSVQTRELPLADTVVSNIQKETPFPSSIVASTDIKPEVPASEPTENVDLIDVTKSESSPDHNNVSLDETSKILGDEKEIKIRDFPGESENPEVSDSLEGHGNGGVNVAVQDASDLFSNQVGHGLEKDPTLEDAACKPADTIASLDEPSKTLEAEGRTSLLPSAGNADKAAQAFKVLDSDQARETPRKEIITTPAEHLITRQGSSQEGDSWTCRRCGWVYPNPHPSAKHRRNHKKHCGKLKGFEVRTDLHKGGSSDDVSSDEDKKVHSAKHVEDHSPQTVENQNRASGMIETDTTALVGDLGSSNLQSIDPLTSKADSSTGGVLDTPSLNGITPSMESTDADPKYSVSSEQKNLPGEEGKVAVDLMSIAPSESQAPVISLSLTNEERPLNQVAPETEVDAVHSSISSEGLSTSTKDASIELGLKSEVAKGLHQHSEDCTPVVEKTPSLSNVLSSGASQPTDVGSSAEGGERSTIFVPIADLRASGIADESLEAFAGARSYQDVYPAEKSDESAEPVQPNSLAGETLQAEILSDSALVLPAANFPVLEALSTSANVTRSSDDTELEEKIPSVQAMPNSVEFPLTNSVSGPTGGHLEDPSSLFVNKAVGTAQVMEMPPQFSDKPGTSVGEFIPEERTTPADTSGEPLSSNDTPRSITISSDSESHVTPERAPLVSVGDTQVPSTKDKVSGQTVDALENTPSSSIEKVVETQVTEMPVQSSDNPATFQGLPVSKERTPADTTGESLSINGKPATTIISPEADIALDKVASVLVGDTLPISTVVDTANDPAMPTFLNVTDSNHLYFENYTAKDETGEAMGPLEVFDKPETKHDTPDETEIGYSDQSLDETNSFKNAESELSQRSEFAASSHKLSDSLELFEDAPDTLEACSVGGSIEETESLDEPRQVADGIQEGSKLSRGTSLDKRVPGVTNELEENPKASNEAGDMQASFEEKATMMLAGTSHAVRGKMEELKAPSPEAWQEPGPSMSKKEGTKLNISEVLEDGKSGESHTALRSLMANEGKDKTDHVGASSLDTADSNVVENKGASAKVAKQKSRLKSLWSQCICCPTVH